MATGSRESKVAGSTPRWRTGRRKRRSCRLLSEHGEAEESTEEGPYGWAIGGGRA